MRIFKPIAVLALLAWICAACGVDNPATISITDAWMRPGIAGGNSAIYFTVENLSDREEVLQGTQGDIAEAYELHRTTISEDDMMSMHHQMSIPIAANEQVLFEPGGLHVMVINLKRDVDEGEIIPLVLKFKTAGEIKLDVPVKQE
jgi:hypothetical protein